MTNTENSNYEALRRCLTELTAAASPGPWYFNSYSAVFSKPLTDRWEDLPDEEADKYENDPIVLSVPAKYGDTAPLGSRQYADAALAAPAHEYAAVALAAAEVHDWLADPMLHKQRIVVGEVWKCVATCSTCSTQKDLQLALDALQKAMVINDA